VVFSNFKDVVTKTPHKPLPYTSSLSDSGMAKQTERHRLAWKLAFGWMVTSFNVKSWPLEMEPIGCPETSLVNYNYSLRNSPR